MVITEAMAHGVPVITTRHTAGADLIRDGVNGWLVPVRDVEALTEVMHWCLHHRDKVVAAGEEAARSAARWQWSDYRARLASCVREAVGKGCEQGMEIVAGVR